MGYNPTGLLGISTLISNPVGYVGGALQRRRAKNAVVVSARAQFRKLRVVATALCCRVPEKEDAPTTDWKGRRPPAGQIACAQHSPEGDRRSAKWSDYNVSVLNALFST